MSQSFYGTIEEDLINIFSFTMPNFDIDDIIMTHTNETLLIEIYFVKLEDVIFHFEEGRWRPFHKSEDRITIADIIKHGCGINSPYLTSEHLQVLGELGLNGRIEYVVGTHTIEELKNSDFIDHETRLELNRIYRYNIVKEES
jgi:hypothetical protein